jgi:hypothetical protein
MRGIAVALVATFALLAHAAPVPKAVSAKNLQEVYGEVADSGCKCEMTKDGVLQITVPKDVRATELTHNSRTLPLTTKTVQGDFELTVRMKHAPPKDAERAEGAKQPPTVSAGITVHTDGDPRTSVTFVHKHTKKGDKWTSGLAMQSNYQNGSSGSGRSGTTLEEKPLYLRITRRGEMVTAETSTDGKKWSRFTNQKADRLGETLVVGPVAFQNTTAEYDVEFDQYEIKPLKEEKK